MSTVLSGLYTLTPFTKEFNVYTYIIVWHVSDRLLGCKKAISSLPQILCQKNILCETIHGRNERQADSATPTNCLQMTLICFILIKIYSILRKLSIRNSMKLASNERMKDVKA